MMENETPGQHRLLISGSVFRLWPIALPLILLLPGILSFPYSSSEALFSDLSLTHYPYAIYLRESIVNNHTLPLWSPLFFSGSPFAANPLSGLWYPPGWLALLFPLPLGFNVMVLAHLLWGGVGLYQLLREEGLDHYPSLFGGMAFAAMPKLFAHYGAGHLTLLYAIPWTPWLLAASRRAVRNGQFTWRSIGRLSLEAPVLALICLADPRWSFFAGLLWAAYQLFGIHDDAETHPIQLFCLRLVRMAYQGFLALLLAAPLLLPMLEFASLSSRSGMTTVDQMAYSLPWPRLVGLFVPDFGGFHEYMLYAGQVTLLLAPACLINLHRRRNAAIFWLVTWCVTVCFAMAGYVPFMKPLFNLPLLSLLRVPSRSLFLAGMSMAMLATYSFQALLENPMHLKEQRFGLILAGYTGFIAALALGSVVLKLNNASGFLWGAFFALSGSIWLGLRLGVKIPDRTWIIGLFVIALMDWGMIDRTLFSPRPVSQVLSESQTLAEKLALLEEKEGTFRVYSPSYSLPQQTATRFNLQLADGVDPLYLQSYAEFMERATGVPTTGYSVTIPSFGDGEPGTSNANDSPDPELLGLLNVRYLVSAFELDVDGLVYEGQQDGTRLYRNLFTKPRAWVQPDDSLPDGEIHEVENLSWSPDRIEFQAQGPGLAVLSEIFYPGWQVWVDGQRARLDPYQGLLRSVIIGPGKHSISFCFKPMSVYWGILVGGLAWLGLAVSWMFWRRKLR